MDNDSSQYRKTEMWVWRRMLKISWVDKVSNAEENKKTRASSSLYNIVNSDGLDTS